MAIMHPDKLTEAFSGYHVDSERVVYDKLTRELGNRYHVFHDFMWDDPSLDDSKTAGQIDFVIVQPERGYITLEVKGGRCNYNPEYRSWSSLDREGGEHQISDPFEQSRIASRVIWKLLLKQPALSNKYIPYHHAVLFPDCVFKKRDIRADMHAWQLLDQESLYDLNKSIDNLFEKAFPKGHVQGSYGKQILAGIRQLYGDRPLKGQTPSALRIRQIADKLIKLTDRQVEVLQLLREQKRMVIRGCAGSGKTTLAVHKAKMLAEQGNKVLLVCFNKPLSQYLKYECESQPKVVVGSFHDLCFEWMEEIDIEVNVDNTNEWWSETFPNLVADHIDAIKHRFDAIVVDEGQDFKDAYWVFLEMLLANPEESVFYIFADASQNIYHGTTTYPMTSPPVVLDRNIRNTNEVFAAVKHACELPNEVKPSGVSGPDVELLSYSTDNEMLHVIAKLMQRLISEGIRPADVVILGTKSQQRTVLKYGTKIGPFRLVEANESANDIVTMTVHRFKGLESPVVILCEFDEQVRFNWKELLYIGLTRSTGALYVLGQEETISRLNKSLNLKTESL